MKWEGPLLLSGPMYGLFGFGIEFAGFTVSVQKLEQLAKALLGHQVLVYCRPLLALGHCQVMGRSGP